MSCPTEKKAEWIPFNNVPENQSNINVTSQQAAQMSKMGYIAAAIGELKQDFNVGCIIRVQIDKIGEVIMHQFGGFSYGTC